MMSNEAKIIFILDEQCEMSDRLLPQHCAPLIAQINNNLKSGALIIYSSGFALMISKCFRVEIRSLASQALKPSTTHLASFRRIRACPALSLVVWLGRVL